jgi:Baculovirus FP protein
MNSNKSTSSKAPILVKLSDSRKKGELVSKLRSKKVLMLSEIHEDFQHDQRTRIFLRDDLTPLQRDLFKEAKNIQEMFKLKFAWMKDGDIFVRKEENAKVYAINNRMDLMKVSDIFSNQK